MCGVDCTASAGDPVFVEAGKWLAEEIWNDGGLLCQQCLENRARLAMMYLNEHNT
jgi:hypothetical protein